MVTSWPLWRCPLLCPPRKKSVPPSLQIQASIWLDCPSSLTEELQASFPRSSRLLPQDNPQEVPQDSVPLPLPPRYSWAAMLSFQPPLKSNCDISTNSRKVIAINSMNCKMWLQRTQWIATAIMTIPCVCKSDHDEPPAHCKKWLQWFRKIA